MKQFAWIICHAVALRPLRGSCSANLTPSAQAHFSPRRRATTIFGIIRGVRPSNTMRSTAPFAVSAAPAETKASMNTAYTVIFHRQPGKEQQP